MKISDKRRWAYGTLSVTKIKGLYRHIRTLFRAEIRISFMCISLLVYAHIRQYSALVLRSSPVDKWYRDRVRDREYTLSFFFTFFFLYLSFYFGPK